MSDLQESTRTTDPTLDGDHERMAHIVLEAARFGDEAQERQVANVTAAYIEGTPVRALCGKVWVPSRDPTRYPLCPACKEIAEGLGWQAPA